METAFNQITDFLLSQSIHLAVLFIGIAALVWLLNKRSAHLRYLLWLIVLIKCLIPPLLTVPVAVLPQPREIVSPAPLPQTEAIEETTVTYLPPARPQPVYQYAETEPVDSVSEPAAANEPPAPLFTVQRAAILWIFGSILYLAWVLIRAVRFQLRLRRQRIRPADSIKKEITELAGQFWPGLKVRSFLLEGIGQPFVWGLWRGTIYLPANFAHSTKDKQRHAILLHEMAHVARADAFVNLIQIIAQGLYWFHPLVWIANRMIRAEREKCCDETAIAKLKTTPKEYGGAIVEVLTAEYQNRMAIPSLAVAGPAKNIEDRLKTIMNPKRKFYTRPTFIAFMMILLLASIIIPTTVALIPQKRTPAFEVSGTVVDAQTGKPIAGATVFDDGYGPEPRQETTTDPNGVFRYKTWNEEHNITAQAIGYESQMIVLLTFPFDNSDRLHFKLEPRKSKVIAVVLGKQIFLSDLEPRPEMVEQNKNQMSKEQYSQWLRQHRESALRSIIFGTLIEDYTEKEEISATDDEITAHTRLTEQRIAKMQTEWQQRRDTLVEELESPDVSDERKEEIESLIKIYDQMIKRQEDFENLPEEIEAKKQSTVLKELSKRFIRSWKINQSLYKKYGGRVIFQQAGPEPLDAYREFLKEQEDRGRFEIRDPQAAEMFWNYYVNDKMHVFMRDKEEVKKAMETPWWLMDSEENENLPPGEETKVEIEGENPEAAAGTMRITFVKDMLLTDALRMLSQYYKQNIIPSEGIIKARGCVPVTDLYDVTSLEMALDAILGTNRYVKDGNFIRVYTAEEYAALRPEEKMENEKSISPQGDLQNSSQTMSTLTEEDRQEIENLMQEYWRLDRGGYQPDLADLIQFENQLQKERFIDSLRHKGAMPKDAALPVYTLDIVPYRKDTVKIWALLPYSETYMPETFLCGQIDGKWKILPDPEKFIDQKLLGTKLTSTEFVIKQNRQQLAEWENAEGPVLKRLIEELKIDYRMQIQAFQFTQEHSLKTNIQKDLIEYYERTLDTMNTVNPEQLRQSILVQLRAFFGQSSVGDNILTKEIAGNEKIPVKVSMKLLLLPDDERKVQRIFEKAGIVMPEILTDVHTSTDEQRRKVIIGEATFNFKKSGKHTFLDAGGVQALIAAVQQEKEGVVLSAPSVITWSGEQAEIRIADTTETPSEGLVMQICPDVLQRENNIHLKLDLELSNTFFVTSSTEAQVEVAEISTELTLPEGNTFLLAGPRVHAEHFVSGNVESSSRRLLLLLITPEIVKKDLGRETSGLPMGNLPGGFGAFRSIESRQENTVDRDDLIGWYQMKNDTLVPVFKRDGAYCSVSRGFEIPLRECPEGLIEAHTPPDAEGTTIGRYHEDPDKYFISIVDRQRENFEESFVSGQKQEMEKIKKPFEPLESDAPAPQSLDDFLGWYQPVWFPVVRLELRKENQSYFAAEHYTNESGQWTTGHTEELTPLTEGLGFAEDGEPVSWIYNDALRRFEITLKTDDTLVRMPLARVSPDEKEGVKTLKIGIPYWH